MKKVISDETKNNFAELHKLLVKMSDYLDDWCYAMHMYYHIDKCSFGGHEQRITSTFDKMRECYTDEIKSFDLNMFKGKYLGEEYRRLLHIFKHIKKHHLWMLDIDNEQFALIAYEMIPDIYSFFVDDFFGTDWNMMMELSTRLNTRKTFGEGK